MQKIKQYINTLGGKRFVFIIFLRIIDTMMSLLSLSLIYPLTSYFLEREEFLRDVTGYLPLIGSYPDDQKTYIIGLIMIAYLIFRYFFGLWALKITVKYSVNQRFKWVNTLANYYFQKDYLSLKTDKSGRLVSEWYNDTYNGSVFLTLLITIVNDLTFVIMFLVFIMVTNPVFGLWAALLFLCILALYYAFKNKTLNKQSTLKVLFIQNVMTILTEIILHIRDVKIFQLYGIAKSQVKTATDELGDVFIENSQLSKKATLYTELFIIGTVSSIFIIIGFGAVDMTTLDLSLMVLYVALGFRSLNYLTKVVTSFNKLKIEFVSFKDISSRLKKTLTEDDVRPSLVQNVPFQKIILKDFEFEFSDTSVIFQPTDLEIPLGKHILIVGDSGSGKSTFLDILVGLYTSYQGQMSIIDQEGNVVANHINLFGYVSQSVGLFGRSFEECICGILEFNEEKFHDILSLCDLQDVYATQKNSFNISSFSGGERLRLGLARAIYYERPIIILDESLASVEYSLEKRIIEGLKQRINSLTLLQVAHERSMDTSADYRLKVGGGTLQIQTASR